MKNKICAILNETRTNRPGVCLFGSENKHGLGMSTRLHTFGFIDRADDDVVVRCPSHIHYKFKIYYTRSGAAAKSYYFIGRFHLRRERGQSVLIGENEIHRLRLLGDTPSGTYCH